MTGEADKEAGQGARIVRELQAAQQELTVYRHLLEQMGVGYVLFESILDTDQTPYDYRFIEANSAFADYCGQSREAIIGRTVRELFPGSAPEWMEALGEARTSGRIQQVALQTGAPKRHRQVTVYPPSDGRLAALWTDATGPVPLKQSLCENETRLRQQAAELELIYQTAPIGLCVLDTELRFIHVNARLAEFNGVPVEAHLGRGIREVIPKVAERIEPLLRHVLETGEPIRGYESSGETPAKPGVQRYWINQFWPLKDEEARPYGINVVAEEITAQKKAEEVYRRERAFRALAENIPDVVVRFDRELRRIYANPAIERFVGRPRSAVIGKTNRELGMPEAIADFLDGQLSEALATGQSRKFEVTLPTPNDPRFVEANLVPETGPTGQVETVLGISRDITERKRAEETLREYAEGLRLLSNTAQKLLQPLDAREIFGFVTERIYTLSEGGIVLFNEFDLPHRKTILRGLACTPEERTIAQRALGRDPVGLTLDFPEAVRERFIPGGFEHLGGGLCELAFFQLPQPVCDKLEHDLQIGHVFAMACSVEQDILGTVAIMTHRHVRLRNKHLIESIVSQAALALRRRRTEEELQRQRNFIDTVLDTEGAVVAILDRGYRIVRLNRTYHETMQVTPEQTMGCTFPELMESESAHEVLQQLDALVQGRRTGEYDSRVAVGGGGFRTVRWRNTALRDDEGAVDHIIAAGIDITDRILAEDSIKALNRDLNQRARDLENANRELETFSYSVTHDLRRPLRAIISLSEVLQADYSERLGQTGRDTLDLIVTSGKKLNQMIDDILNLAKVSRQALNIQEINLTPMAESVITELRSSQPDRPIETAIRRTSPVEADGGLMYIALANLIGNAWKYTRKTQGPRIEFGSLYRDDMQLFYVRDNGPGFDMNYAEKLFRPFERLHTEKEFEGTGVGLATVARIIDRHGGRIWADSKIGKGATFYFTLDRSRHRRAVG